MATFGRLLYVVVLYGVFTNEHGATTSSAWTYDVFTRTETEMYKVDAEVFIGTPPSDLTIFVATICLGN